MVDYRHQGIEMPEKSRDAEIVPKEVVLYLPHVRLRALGEEETWFR